MSKYKEEMIRAAIRRKGLKAPPKRLPRPLPPYAIERAYMENLFRMTSRMETLTREIFFPRLAHYVAANLNSIRKYSWQDDLYDDAHELSIKFYSEFTDKEIKEMARKAGLSVSQFNAQNLNNQIGSVLGIDLFGSEPWVEDQLTLFALNNVQLIKTIPQRFFNELAQEVYSGLADGDRVEDIQSAIEDRFGVSEWNAERIARDQVGKLNGSLNEQRQRDVGVDEYTWLGVGDEREREEHTANNDKTFKWDDPPETGHPGDEIMCRCTAQPSLDKFFD